MEIHLDAIGTVPVDIAYGGNYSLWSMPII